MVSQRGLRERTPAHGRTRAGRPSACAAVPSRTTRGRKKTWRVAEKKTHQRSDREAGCDSRAGHRHDGLGDGADGLGDAGASRVRRQLRVHLRVHGVRGRRGAALHREQQQETERREHPHRSRRRGAARAFFASAARLVLASRRAALHREMLRPRASSLRDACAREGRAGLRRVGRSRRAIRTGRGRGSRSRCGGAPFRRVCRQGGQR